MQVKMEIIDAVYSIEDLEKNEYELIKEGLREVISEDFRRSPELSRRGLLAEELLESMG